jgi:hypothetical protein
MRNRFTEDTGLAAMSKQSNLIPFRRREAPRSYEAKSQIVETCGGKGVAFLMAGELEGLIDFCVTDPDGSHRTYQLSRDEATLLANALLAVVRDVNENCLFDRDPLLVPADYRKDDKSK